MEEVVVGFLRPVFAGEVVGMHFELMRAAIYRPENPRSHSVRCIPPHPKNTRFDCIPSPSCKERGVVKTAQAPFALAAADDGLLSFFAATFAPIKFERSSERLAETLLR
jgi:hypothetical protein